MDEMSHGHETPGVTHDEAHSAAETLVQPVAHVQCLQLVGSRARNPLKSTESAEYTLLVFEKKNDSMGINYRLLLPIYSVRAPPPA